MIMWHTDLAVILKFFLYVNTHAPKYQNPYQYFLYSIIDISMASYWAVLNSGQHYWKLKFNKYLNQKNE